MQYSRILKLLFLLAFFVLSGNISSQEYTISGYIEDGSSAEKLIGANVFDGTTFSGTITNTYGFYSITLPAGKVDLRISYIGYSDYVEEINLTGDIKKNISLSFSNELDEVEIVAESQKNIAKESAMSANEIPIQQIKKIPALLGEVDVIKALQLLPGVQSGSEGQSGLYVRGGSPDQNLILLDGVPVYNVNHLFGFLSVFNADAIKDVKLIKGGFPARYGGRLSSVLDINLKEGNMKEFHGSGSIGIVASKLTLEGPIKTDKTSFVLSGRRTYVDLLARPFIKSALESDNLDGGFGYYFYDVNAKINHIFSDKDRLFFSVYAGNDRFFFDSRERDEQFSEFIDTEFKWGNITSSLRWNHLWSQKLFSNTSLTFTRYQIQVNATTGFDDFLLDEREEISLGYDSGIFDVAAKIDFDYYPSPLHFLRFGAAITQHNFVPGEFDLFSTSSDGQNDIDITIGQDNIQSYEINTYVEDDFEITDKLKVNGGLHFSSFFVQDEIYTSLQPRISMRYLVSDDQSFKASFASMAQYINLLANEGIGLPTDIWVPSTSKILPQRSWQVAAGYAFKVSKDLDMTLEGFYKDMSNLVAYGEGEGFFDDSFRDFGERVVQGDGRAFGAEFLLQKKAGRFTGWLGYTWSKSLRTFDDLNGGEEFPFLFDRRHDISIVAQYELSKRVSLSGTWVYGTGNAVTLGSSNYNALFNGTENGALLEVENFTERNDFRLNAFHRMDIGINFTKKKRKHTRVWSIGAYNTYNRKNPFFIEIQRDRVVDNNGNRIDTRSLIQRSLFPIIPYFNYSFTF